jgi:hypothetical protein
MPHDDSHDRFPPHPRRARTCATCGGHMHPLPIGARECTGCSGDETARMAARGIAQLETMLALHAALSDETS